MKLIVFSGGLDSTALLAREFKDAKEDFETCYIPIYNNQNQYRKEMKARTKIIKRLQDLYPYSKFKGDNIFEYANHTLFGNESVLFMMTFVFLTTLVWNIGYKYQTISFGFVKGDDFWHMKTEFLEAFKSLYQCSYYGHGEVKIEFPIEWSSKKVLYNELETINIENLISYCEIAKNPPCGECVSCKRHLIEAIF